MYSRIIDAEPWEMGNPPLVFAKRSLKIYRAFLLRALLDSLWE